MALVVTLVAKTTPASACGWSGEECGTCTAFFAPEVIDEPKALPFFLTTDRYYDDWRNETDEPVTEANTAEWMSYFDGNVPKKAVEELVYKATLADVDFIIFSLQKKPTAQGSELARRLAATLEKHPGAPKAVKALFYLGFAKRVEPFATARGGDPWANEPAAAPAPAPPATIAALIKSAEKQASAVGDDFLRQRYRFQSLRLLFFTKDYEKAKAYFEDHLAEMTGESSVRYRFLAVAAGALYRSKQFARANYLYSLVFAGFPPLRKSAFFSFHPQEEADWRQTLAFATSPREKAQLWQMFGIYHDGLRAIREIDAIDPKSELLPLMLVRAVNAFEVAHTSDESGRATIGKETLELVRKIAQAGQAVKPELWWLALGHLQALTGEARLANESLDKVSGGKSQSAAVQRQLALSRVVARLAALGRAKAQDLTTPAVAKDLTWLQETAKAGPQESERNRVAQYASWSRTQMSGALARGGDEPRAQLLEPRYGTPFFADNQKIDALIALIDNPTKSPFDAFAVALTKPDRKAYDERKGINFLYAGKFAAAATMFKAASPNVLPGDPFLSHIEDCHDCDHGAPKARAYTKEAFAARMAELEARVAKKDAQSAQAAYDLATGYYNMSYFGNSRVLFQDRLGGLGSFEQLDVSQAQKHYETAIALSSDREFQARAHFMAAKAERDTIYLKKRPTSSWDLEDQPTFVTGEHFKALKAAYADTKYFQEILAECGFFARYAGEKKD